jgi:serine/threonine protein kinase
MTDAFGIDLDIEPFSGRIHPDYNTPDFRAAISDCSSLLSDPSSRILDESRNRIGVVRLSPEEGRTVEIVIKKFRTLGVDKLKSFFLASKAQKAWRGSLALVDAGLGTPLPVAYLEKRKGVFLQQSYFLSEYISGMAEIRGLFRELSSGALDELLEELACCLSRCAEAGIDHRDLSDGNILVQKVPGRQNRFFLLDTNRIRCKKRVGTLRGIKSLIRLGIPRDHQKIFLAHYVHRPGIGGWLWLWYRLNKVSYTNFVAIKRVLGLRKIAQKLKIQ